MSSELVNKVKKLKEIVIQRNNDTFKSSAIEILNPNKVKEDMFVAPSNPFSDVVEAPTKEIPDKGASVEETPAEEVPTECSDEDFLKIESYIRKSIAEEQEAAAVYIKRAAKCIDMGFDKLAGLFKELAGDEIVHAASLETALDIYGLFDIQKFVQGQEEAEQLMLPENLDDIAKKEHSARKAADEFRKNFDFVKEYTDDKAKYKKEQIVTAINDLILGKNAVDDVVATVLKIMKPQKKEEKKDKKA